MRNNVTMVQDSEVWVLLGQTQHVLARAREKGLEQIGLSTMQADVLSIVKSTKGPLTPSMLSRRLFREPHTISGLVTRMGKQGLVKKTKDLKRKNLVRITFGFTHSQWDGMLRPFSTVHSG